MGLLLYDRKRCLPGNNQRSSLASSCHVEGLAGVLQTSYQEYVHNQRDKDIAVSAVHDAVGRPENVQNLATPWINGLKVHAALLPLAEFMATIGNLRGARFGRASAWRVMACLGALDEFRHTQIPLLLMHELVRWNPQFDWAHKFYHTNNWLAIAA